MKDLKLLLLSTDVQLITSEALIAEVMDVGTRGHLRRYFDEARLREFVELLRHIGDLVEDPSDLPKASRDPNDDYLLALSKASKADVLLTGDKDLLVLEQHGRTRILTPRNFVKRYLR